MVRQPHDVRRPGCPETGTLDYQRLYELGVDAAPGRKEQEHARRSRPSDDRPARVRVPLGEVGANPTGALTLEVARALHEEHYFSEAGTDRDRFENAMERTNVLSGLMDGSAAGATLESAVRADAASDAHVQGIMDLITGGIGLVDMRVPHPVGVAIGIGIDITADAITSAWQEALHEYDGIAAGTAEVIDVDQRIAMYANAERYYDFLQLEQQGVTAPPERDGYDSEAAYVDAYGDWYSEVIEHPSMPANGTADYDNSWALAWGLAAGNQGASVQNGTGDDEG